MKCPPDNHHWIRFVSVDEVKPTNAILCTICGTVGMLHVIGGHLILDDDMTKPLVEFVETTREKNG